MQTTCSFYCAIDLGKKRARQKARKVAYKRKKEFNEGDKSYWKKKAREWLHKWIRDVRDADQPCISCGKVFGKDEKADAGHFHSDGGHSFLRYHEWNIHKQCVRCNQHLSGNIKEYVKRLPDRIGQEAFDWMDEHQNDLKSWTLDELKAIANKYKFLYKENAKQSTIYDIKGIK